jgi:hypothetical protein
MIFDKEFEEDPFERQLGNPRNFFCPDSRHSPTNPTPPRTPPYSASSDEESEHEVDSSSSTIPPRKFFKAGSKSVSKSGSALRTKINSSVQSVSDAILHPDGDPIDFHVNRSGETTLRRNRDQDVQQTIEPDFDYFEEPLQEMSQSKSGGGNDDSSSSEEEEDLSPRDGSHSKR